MQGSQDERSSWVILSCLKPNAKCCEEDRAGEGEECVCGGAGVLQPQALELLVSAEAGRSKGASSLRAACRSWQGTAYALILGSRTVRHSEGLLFQAIVSVAICYGN